MPDIADLIAQYIGPQDDLGVTDATLTKTTNGARDPVNLSAGTQPTPASYTARGYVEATGQFMDGTLVKENHVIISLLGGTIAGGAVPAAGDSVTIASKAFPAGKSYPITRIVADQVGAIYQCEGRR